MSVRSDLDLLSNVLRSIEMSASVFAHGDYCGSWSVDSSGSGKACFHLIGRGSCFLHLPDRPEPIALASGDLIVFPHDARHRITPERDPEAASAANTTVLCGSFDFGDNGRNPVLEALPDVVHVTADESAEYGLMEAITRLLLCEARQGHAGRQLVLDSLAQALFVMLLRYAVKRACHPRGLLAALADARLARTLEALHAEPGAAWTVEGMARVAGMSRTAFSTRFTELAGDTPMRYLTALRLRTARRLLADRRRSVGQIAEMLGYGEETSFRRAYARFFGEGPGARRRLAQAQSV